MKKVFVGLSGGVDSSVSACLLKKAGYDVRAVFMLNWKEKGACDWEEDLRYARAVAKRLSIPLSIWDFAKEYKESVFEDFIAAYKKGFTPNPDVFCNKYIKFGSFYNRARKEGADFVATGHYARITQNSKLKIQNYGRFSLLSAVDKTKDQSDFLYQIKRIQLSHILFPVGGMLKSEVKTLAKKIGLPNWNKPESMGVCFIGEMNMKKFLEKYIPPKKGNIMNLEAEKVGEHSGAWYYTLGQREGLNIGGRGPYFVVRKNLKRNILTVASEPEAGRLLMVRRVILGNVNFFVSPTFVIARSEATRQSPFDAQNEIARLDSASDRPSRDGSMARFDEESRRARQDSRINVQRDVYPRNDIQVKKGVSILWRDRHLASLQKGVLRKERGRWVADFNQPKRSVTPGQSLVMYDLKGERVVGGGVIKTISNF